MASVTSLVVIWALTLATGQDERLATLPEVDLPRVNAKPVNWSRDHMIVSVTTTDIHGSEPGARHVGASRDGNCRVFINDRLVSSEEFYDQAFSRLERGFQIYSGGEPWRPPRERTMAYIRADTAVPWRCSAGTIYNIEAAGYVTVKFLTTPIA